MVERNKLEADFIETEFLSSSDILKVTAKVILQRVPVPFSKYYSDFIFKVNEDAFNKRMEKIETISTATSTTSLKKIARKITDMKKELQELCKKQGTQE